MVVLRLLAPRWELHVTIEEMYFLSLGRHSEAGSWAIQQGGGGTRGAEAGGSEAAAEAPLMGEAS